MYISEKFQRKEYPEEFGNSVRIKEEVGVDLEMLGLQEIYVGMKAKGPQD